MEWTQEEMDRIFNPRVVAVVGAKRDTDYTWVRSVLPLKGKVYSVQIDEREIPGILELGIPNYTCLQDVPEAVDYVIVAVPRAVAPRVLADAIEKRVGGIMFFTAGFAETGTDEGGRLQALLTEMASKAGMKVVGPNCMGIYNPKVGLRFSENQAHGEGGNVGFLSQSGTQAHLLSTVGYSHGLRISKAVSFGNGIVLHAADYLEYLGRDPETEVIGAYIEGVPDGRRFFRVLRDVAAKKPVVVWKAGRSPEGARAARSHTASLAASSRLWDAVLRQCGAIQVDAFDEMLDALKALAYIRPTADRRMGLVATTGGQSVSITDAFASEGLLVPELTARSYQEYAQFFSIIGGSYRNPLDMTPNSGTPKLIRRCLDILGADEHVDAVAYDFNLGLATRERQEFWEGLVAELVGYKDSSSKPFFVSITAGHREEQALRLRQRLAQAGIASYPSFPRAAAAFRRLVEHAAFRREVDEAG
ncbi:MAG: CoA-binding protein [Chloroflexi bacterium]|nr:CoA-binding protein [Chloroflexota bacterium]